MLEIFDAHYFSCGCTPGCPDRGCCPQRSAFNAGSCSRIAPFAGLSRLPTFILLLVFLRLLAQQNVCTYTLSCGGFGNLVRSSEVQSYSLSVDLLMWWNRQDLHLWFRTYVRASLHRPYPALPGDCPPGSSLNNSTPLFCIRSEGCYVL